MKIATWNVNSLKVRLPQVLKWVNDTEPDVLALQETKLTDDSIPGGEIEAAGYRIVANGQRTYNGVALMSRNGVGDIVRDLQGFDDDSRRYIAATVNGLRIINVYVPNGQSLASDKYAYKLDWLRALKRNIRAEMTAHERLLLLGDFNIAPHDQDVCDPERWQNSVLVSDRERAAFFGLLDLGLIDLFRQFEQPPDIYTWWDYRARSFQRNAGLRIDIILGSVAASRGCRSVQVDRRPRSWERPSDHAPVIAVFDD